MACTEGGLRGARFESHGGRNSVGDCVEHATKRKRRM